MIPVPDMGKRISRSRRHTAPDAHIDGTRYGFDQNVELQTIRGDVDREEFASASPDHEVASHDSRWNSRAFNATSRRDVSSTLPPYSVHS